MFAPNTHAPLERVIPLLPLSFPLHFDLPCSEVIELMAVLRFIVPFVRYLSENLTVNSSFFSFSFSFFFIFLNYRIKLIREDRNVLFMLCSDG